MHLVERHVIRHTDPRLTALAAAAFASKRSKTLYTTANDVVQQAFIHEVV